MKAYCVAFLLGAGALAQEIDTVNFKLAASHGSILDRAESEAERKDFLALQKARAPVQRRALADTFLERYPASWLLATVYQIAAGASLELNDRARALEEGRASLRLLPENAPLLVVLAQISIAIGRPADAARDARDALLWLSVFAPPAGVKDAEWKSMVGNLEEAARAVIDRAGGKQPWIERPLIAGRKRLKFAGSQACKPCHAAQHEAWRKTGMSGMLRPIGDAAVLANFSQLFEFPAGPGTAKIRAGGGDRPYFEVAQPGGTWKRFRVDYAIGSKWQQAYATRLPDDRLFVFPIQYSALHKKWINYWATIDPAGSERADIGTFSHLSSETSYQRNCAACHTSQLRLLRLDDATMQKARFKEPGINCEMCHGPSARHAAAMSGREPEISDSDVPPFRFSRLDHATATLICGQCHRQSALRNLGSNGEMNYTQDAPWFDRLRSQPFQEFGARAFYKDGRFRETTFIGESFLRSACFRRGTAQCASCHDPHPRDAGENPTSLKFRDNPDQMCIQCHTSVGAQAVRHTHHPANSAGARCAACHMPPIMNSLLFQARSHQIDDIPRADATARFGEKDSPNACLMCHQEKDVRWVGRQLDSWTTAAAGR